MQPSQIGPYAIVNRLGRGGMGAVFEATDPTGQHVAVKVLAAHLADDTGLRKRFDAEIATLKSLRHPGIVQLLAFGEEDDQPYFAMELVPGQSLEQLLRSGRRFTWRETVSVALAVTRALKAAHDHGVVHRDLKPANLLVADGAEDDLGARVKLADFGIAKLFGGAAHTAHGNIVGTAEYMAPEQAGGGPVDHRVDLYALGLVMFAMLAGRPPFSGGTAAEVIRKQQVEPAPRVSTCAGDVPEELDLLISRLLSKDPGSRPPNALALGRLLTAIETLHPVSDAAAGPLTELPLPTPPPERRGVDLFAPTSFGTARADVVVKGDTAEAHTLAATGALAGNTTKPIDADSVTGAGGGGAGATVVERAPRTRFTTVADLDREASEQAARARLAEQRWQAVAALVTLALLAAGGYLLLKQPTVDELHGRIEAAQTSAATGGDLRDALPEIEQFLKRFPDDPRAGQVRSLARSLALDVLEKRARRRPLGGGTPSPLERDYRAAMEREPDSPSACRDALEALISVHQATDGKPNPTARPADAPSLWIDLARRQIDRLGPLSAKEQAEDARKIAEIFRRAEAIAAEAARTVGGQQETLLARRRALLESIVDLYATRPHAAAAVATARKLLAE
ncbi:MAG: serine/threonine-protein kinase [Planctomycetia bacterium]